jgi:hypothetical protein
MFRSKHYVQHRPTCLVKSLLLLLIVVELVVSMETCVVVSTSGEATAAASGTYCEDGIVNDAPKYRQQSGRNRPYWLYRASKAVWTFTANESGIEKGKGTIVSKERSSDGPVGLTYKYYAKSSSTWNIDTSISVQEGGSIDASDSRPIVDLDDPRSTSRIEGANLNDSKASASIALPCFAQTPYPHFSGSLELSLAVRAEDGTQSRLSIEVPINLDGTTPSGKAPFNYSGMFRKLGEQFQDLCSSSIPSIYLDQVGGANGCATTLLTQLQVELHKNICDEQSGSK